MPLAKQVMNLPRLSLDGTDDVIAHSISLYIGNDIINILDLIAGSGGSSSIDSYSKTETYNKFEINTLISNISGVERYPDLSIDNMLNLKQNVLGLNSININQVNLLQSTLDDKIAINLVYSKLEIDSNYYTQTINNALLLLRADLATTYTKKSVDTLLNLKANQLTTYSKIENDAQLLLKANQSTTYTKTENDDLLLLKANQSTSYLKIEIDASLLLKANQSTTYTKTADDALLLLKANQLTTYTKTETMLCYC